MIDFIRNVNWDFVGVLVAVITIILSIAIFLAQRKRKKLTYEIVSKTSVLSAAEEISGKLQILFQGEAVKNVYLLVIKLSNTGNLPITTADFERLVCLKVEKSERILSAEVSETTPPNLSATLQNTDKSIQLNPLLLNPGDTIVIKTLISDYQNDVEIDGRIVGVQNIERRVDGFGRSLLLMSLGLVVLVFGVMRMLINQNPNDYITITLIIIGYIMSYGVIFGNRRTRAMAKKIVPRLSSIISKEK